MITTLISWWDWKMLLLSAGIVMGALVILLGFASFRSEKVERRYLAIEKGFFIFMAVMLLAMVCLGCALKGDHKGNTLQASKKCVIETTFDVMDAIDESQIVEEDWL